MKSNVEQTGFEKRRFNLPTQTRGAHCITGQSEERQLSDADSPSAFKNLISEKYLENVSIPASKKIPWKELKYWQSDAKMLQFDMAIN